MRWPATSAMRARAGVVGHLDEDLGVEGFDDGPVVLGADHDVARQQRGDAGVDREGPVGELGVAGSEDDLGVDVDVELVLEGLADVDLGETPTPWSLRVSLTTAMASSLGAVELDAAGEVHGGSSPVVDGQ